MRTAGSSVGAPTSVGTSQPSITSVRPCSAASTAPKARRWAIERSSAVGWPPRTRCPRMLSLISTQVGLQPLGEPVAADAHPLRLHDEHPLLVPFRREVALEHAAQAGDDLVLGRLALAVEHGVGLGGDAGAHGEEAAAPAHHLDEE